MVKKKSGFTYRNAKFEKIQIFKAFLLSNEKAINYYPKSGVCYCTFLQYIHIAKAYIVYRFPSFLRDTNRLQLYGNYTLNNKKDKHYYLDAINEIEMLYNW